MNKAFWTVERVNLKTQKTRNNNHEDSLKSACSFSFSIPMPVAHVLAP